MTESKEKPSAKTTDIRDYKHKKVVGGIAPDFPELNNQIEKYVGKTRLIKIQVRKKRPFWKR